MKVFKLFIIILIVISCKQEKDQQNSDLSDKKQKNKITTQEKEIDSIYEIYKRGEVNSFDWNIVFNKSKEYRSISKKYSDKKLIPNDFLEFSERFVVDSGFQQNHIDFDKLIAVVGNCEENYVLKESNWVFDDWDFVDNLGIDDEMENTFYFSEIFFFCEYLLKEVGVIRRLGFEKKNNDWYLTLYDINDC